MKIELTNAARTYQLISEGVFPEHFVWWDRITMRDVSEFQDVIENSKSERPLQCYLQIMPSILVQQLHGGHGRWVIPQKKFGSEFIADFVIGALDSLGYHWTAVELESPTEKLFTKAGDPAKALNHAIRQISNWRTWLKDNRDYAVKELGLKDINPRVPGLIIIGRRASLTPNDNKLRRQLSDDLDIQIHTYDYLLQAATQRAQWLDNHPPLKKNKK